MQSFRVGKSHDWTFSALSPAKPVAELRLI